ncbi:pyrroline-5-carboxylate reductase [Sporanaerobium hydrogeniformans]|uniref:Pyrroline-5-carboxylate reductase n=1 Tax=Sporanaerobium hydrogeniformans TaxID=3072179 RepID=A0AC61DEK7_9FIRM|nr:pyrroline-5-carboxylate reductase [Sporanaerobium hydrogeniformans]PHV71734.1 pyrroline-5-carboxylate reductase [Sporanaerobium hydrogeniformans]
MSILGFIGIGNMGGAMASAIASSGEKRLFVYDTYEKAYDKFSGMTNVKKAQTIKELVEQVDYIILSVKPQYYGSVCEQVKKVLRPEQIIITVSPSHSIEQMKMLLGEGVKIVRTMPNTPALINEGITAYCYQQGEISEEQKGQLLKWLGAFGVAVEVEEKLMSAVVATTGSSPAYGYLFIEAMADAAVSLGIPRAMAYNLSAMAIKGACEMVLQTGKHPGELKDAVTSPGGTTIRAVTKLEECGFRNSVIQAMFACYDKAEEMKKQ